MTVKASTNTCQWTAMSGVAWITVTSGSAVTGSGVVSYTVAANAGSTTRTGTITIAGQIFTITQGICTYTITPTSKQIGGSGGTDSVNVTATGICPWSAVFDINSAFATITDGYPDVALLDLRMLGVDALDVFKRIKERVPDVEIIIVSGQMAISNTDVDLKELAFDYIVKPVEIDEVTKKSNRPTTNASPIYKEIRRQY